MVITRILVPTDFSPHAEAAFRYALELAKPFHASVHLVAVVEDPVGAGMWSAEVHTAEIAGLQVNLARDTEQRLRASVPADAGTVTTEVRLGNAAKQILEAAQAEGVDLIVMGTHGRTGIAHVVMGSVAEKIVRLAPCPVLTLRARDAQKDTA
jgi:universal stress protein A